MKALIIYHFEDNDGVCSCALVANHLIGKYDVDYLPSNYASLDKLANEIDFKEYFRKYDLVWMTDVSFNNWEYMKKLYDVMGDKFIWCDHHAPIIKDSFEHGFSDVDGFRDTGRSAILCVYHYLYDPFDAMYYNGTIPTPLRLLSAWDCWSWVKEGLDEDFIRAFNSGVSYKSELNVDWYLNNMLTLLDDGVHVHNEYPYDDACLEFIDEMLECGRTIIRNQDRANENLINGYAEENWKVDGVPNAVMIVTSGPSNSQMFKCVKDKFDHGVVFKHSKEGKWIVSLYNTRNDIDFDCGDYLRKKYGGGGHIGAAGCTLNDEQFFKVIWEKNL